MTWWRKCKRNSKKLRSKETLFNRVISLIRAVLASYLRSENSTQSRKVVLLGSLNRLRVYSRNMVRVVTISLTKSQVICRRNGAIYRRRARVCKATKKSSRNLKEYSSLIRRLNRTYTSLTVLANKLLMVALRTWVLERTRMTLSSWLSTASLLATTRHVATSLASRALMAAAQRVVVPSQWQQMNKWRRSEL